MSDEQRVPRLLAEGSGASDELRSVLQAGDAHEPSGAELARLGARVGAALPPGVLTEAAIRAAASTAKGGAAGAGSAGGVAGATLATKVVIVLAIAAGGAGAAGWLARDRDASHERASPSSVAPASPAPAHEEALEATPSHAAPAPADAGPSDSPRSAKVAATRPAASLQATEPEAALLARAHAAVLGNDPAFALTLTKQHARAYPEGALAQERERIAIEALVKLDRLAEARARAAAFRRAYPGSTHLQRIDALLGEEEP